MTRSPREQRTPDADVLRSAVRLRRELHERPETANAESGTAKRIVAHLRDHGIRPRRTRVGGHGLLYKLKGEGSGPAMLLRAELDGLPIQEEQDLPHRSRIRGRHHACGHDGHMAMLAAALVQMARTGARRGDVFAIFQPAEETGEGAAKALASLSEDRIHFDRVFAIHNFPGLPLGTVAARVGTAARPSLGLEIHMQGTRTHASEPEHGRSPLPALATLVRHVQAKAAPPAGRRSAFATLIGLNTGETNFGVSPGEARLALTLRGDSQRRLDRLVERIERQARSLAASERLRVSSRQVDVFRETRNHPAAVSDVRAAAKQVGLRFTTPARPLSASEDFGRFTERWPGALVLLGAGKDHAPLHHARYDFPDELLRSGVGLWLALAERDVSMPGTRKQNAATV